MTSTLVIEELGPDGNSVLAAVLLVGPGLPHQGAAWGTQLAVTTTWNPGNGAQATQQVTGPREVPSHWSGEWHRTMMGAAPSMLEAQDGTVTLVVDPTTLADALEAMVRRGRRLRVTWSVEEAPVEGPQGAGVGQQALSVSYKIVREGRCKQFVPKYDRVHDVAWEAEFEWASRGGNPARVTSTRGSGVVAKSAAYAAAIQALIDANDAAQNSAKQFPLSTTLGQLAALANLPTAVSNSVSRSMKQLQRELAEVVAIAGAAQSQPANVQQIAVNHARNAMAQTNGVAQTLSQRGVETYSAKGDALSVLRAHALFGGVQDAARLAARAAEAYARQLRSSLPYAAPGLTGAASQAQSPTPGSILAVYRTRQGDTPKRVSQQFYRTPDHDIDILKANQLSWMTPRFPPGFILVIPVLQGVVNPGAA